MIYTIENDILKIDVDSKGAQLFSVYSKKSNTEYLWQGDPAYWTGRAYNLFPFIGRMYNGIYTYQGKEYAIRPHGVARYNEFSVEEHSKNKLVFLLKDNEETYKEYPFHFEYRVIFEIKDNMLSVRQEAKNIDKKTLICGFGGHPGINVPFGNGAFEDYVLEFSKPTNVSQHLLSENKFMANKTAPYPLVDGIKLPLKHSLFDNDAVILENTSCCVAVKSDKERKVVKMYYDDFKYIGFWHACETDAPYVCLEPWSALPATEGKIDDLEQKKDMFHIESGKSASATFTLEIVE